MRTALLLMAVLGTACSGKGEPITKVDGKKSLDKLTADDQKQLCSDLQAYAKKNRSAKADQEAGCKVRAIFETPEEGDDATLRKACQEAFDKCMGETAEPAPEFECKSLEDMKCAVTIDEFVGCLREQQAASLAFASGNVCATVTAGDSAKRSIELLDKIGGGAKCKVIKDRCDKPTDP